MAELTGRQTSPASSHMVLFNATSGEAVKKLHREVSRAQNTAGERTEDPGEGGSIYFETPRLICSRRYLCFT